MHATGRMYKQEQEYESSDTCVPDTEATKNPFQFLLLLLHNQFPLESLAPVTADTPLTGCVMSLHSPVYLSPAERKAECLFPI